MAEERKRPRIFGRLAGTVTILGDIVAPLGIPWEAETEAGPRPSTDGPHPSDRGSPPAPGT